MTEAIHQMPSGNEVPSSAKDDFSAPPRGQIQVADGVAGGTPCSGSPKTGSHT